MKVILAALALFWTANAFAERPDPRDSIILESKTVAPGQHRGDPKDTAAYLYLRVWITNKDTLSNVTLPLEERSLSGGAYATIAWPRSFRGTVSRLTATLSSNQMAVFRSYNSQSPDTFAFAAFFDAADMENSVEPPNAVRRPFWEIKFDSVLPSLGKVQLDSTKLLAVTVQMVDVRGKKVDVNFVKSIVTVAESGKKGKPKTGGALYPTGIFWGSSSPALKNFPGIESDNDGTDRERMPASAAILPDKEFREEPFLR